MLESVWYRTVAAQELAEPVAGGWPVIEVNTGTSLDLERVIEAIARAIPDRLMADCSVATCDSTSVRTTGHTALPAV